MGRRPRRILILVAALIALPVLGACVFGPNFLGQMRAGKYEPTELQTLPAASANTPLAENQTEPHTCGLHAMRSLYVAYGLNPDAFKLRFRLGTDAPAIQADGTSTGTLHPDIYRVLQQDGFAIEPMDLDAANATNQLENHLANRQLALALVYRSTYHWVLLTKGDDSDVLTVIDSLTELPYESEITVFVKDDALSITLVRPMTSDEEKGAAHVDGVQEMLRAAGRK